MTMQEGSRSPASSPSHTSSSPEPRLSYHLVVAQQPRIGAAVRSTTSRIPLSPPLVVEIKTSKTSFANREPAQSQDVGSPMEQNELSFLVAYLSLRSANEETTDSTAAQSSSASRHALSGAERQRNMRILVGTLVASPYQVVDAESGTSTSYFTFPDVAVARPGSYRLAINCSRLESLADSGRFEQGEEVEWLASAVTEKFVIVPFETYEAPPVTPFTEWLIQHQVPMMPPGGTWTPSGHTITQPP